MKKAFTMLEIMIVISIVIIIATALLILSNPKKQVEKSWDGKRKSELSTLKKTYEDYYNDKKCYPRPTEVCYKDNNKLNCPICGSQTPTALLDYVSQLPCDPQNPSRDYLYQVDDINCPTWYRIYSKLSNGEDIVIEEVGCQYGCGPAPSYAYSYGVSSPNIDLERPVGPSATPTMTLAPTQPPSPTPVICQADPAPKYCEQTLNQTNCNYCGLFENCHNACNPPQLYYDKFCQVPCVEQ